MFGDAIFGSSRFGEGPAPEGGAATATFSGFNLLLTLRSVSASASAGVPAGGIFHWPPRFRASERIAVKPATAVFSGHRLAIAQRKVIASGGTAARAGRLVMDMGWRPLNSRGYRRILIVRGDTAKLVHVEEFGKDQEAEEALALLLL